MRTGSEERAVAAALRQETAAAEAELANALGALPGLPPAARAAQRAALEALAGDLLPPAPSGAAGPSRWFLLLAATALLLVAARFGADDGGARRTPSTPSGVGVGEGASPLGGGQPPGGRPGPAAPPPAAAPPSPAATLAGGAGASSAAAGPAVGTVVGTTGRESGKPEVTRPGVATVHGPASMIAPARPGQTAEAPQALTPVAAARAPSAAPCRQEALPALPAGAGPWIVGRIRDESCRPIAEVLVVFTTVAGGTEFLARTEADGSYAVALDPGIYRTELLIDEPWRTAGGLLDGAGMLTRGAADVPLRVDFVVGGGER